MQPDEKGGESERTTVMDASLNQQNWIRRDYNDVGKKLREALDREYAVGEISKSVYIGTLGESSVADAARVHQERVQRGAPESVASGYRANDAGRGK